ncbi:unnamed protein product [Gadus morhua 'NCC']
MVSSPCDTNSWSSPFLSAYVLITAVITLMFRTKHLPLPRVGLELLSAPGASERCLVEESSRWGEGDSVGSSAEEEDPENRRTCFI